LVQAHPQDVLALALPGAEYLGTLPVDVATEPQLVLDALLRVRYQGEECAVDVEAEAQPCPDIGRRLWEYGARASIVARLAVISIVLWLEPGGAPPPSPYVRRVGDWVSTTWNYQGIEVYKLRAEPLFERGLVGLLPLVPFTQDGGDFAVVERAAEVIKERTAAPDFNILESLLLVFGARRFGAEVVRALMGRLSVTREIIETSPLYQEWVRDATEQGLRQGREEGREEGREQGREQGREEGTRNALLTILRGRFPDLPPDVERALAATSPGALDALLPYAGLETLDQIRARLGL